MNNRCLHKLQNYESYKYKINPKCMYYYGISRNTQAKDGYWYPNTKYNLTVGPTYPSRLTCSDFFMLMHDKIHPIKLS